MAANAKVITLEVIVFAITLAAIYRTLVGAKDGIPPQVIADGYDKLDPQYRRKVDRTLGGLLRRLRVAGEKWARSMSRRSVTV